MNCVLFDKNGSGFQLKKNKTNTGKMENKNAGKVRVFCQSGKVGTMIEFNVNSFNYVQEDCF